MMTLLLVLHVMVCVVLITVVLLQRGKGAEIGAVFGGGASSTVFGSRGAGNFLSRLTTGAAVTFSTAVEQAFAELLESGGAPSLTKVPRRAV